MKRTVYIKHMANVFFTLLFGISLSAVGCGSSDSEDITPVNPTEPTDTTATDTNIVTILDTADVADYNKYYKPQELAKMNLFRSDSKWSFTRCKQSEHFILFWEAGFGDDPNASTVSEALRVDVDDFLEKAEQFFAVNVNTLRFAELGESNLDKYKMEIYLLYTTEWVATGGGYDDVVGALWINPSTCKPVGSTIAHEIGHSFQYQVYADMLANGACENDFTRGFRYGYGGNGGNAFWEQTAQWQSFQSYPLEAFESYNFGVHMDNYHRHICHEWQRYASYFIHYYLADKYGIDYVGRIWRESVSPEDPLETHIRLSGMDMDQFNAELYDAATKFVTWDIDNIRDNGAAYIGKHTYKFYTLEDGSYQVAYSRCPGSTGYNVIPLNVPEAGTKVSVGFTGIQPGTALAAGDPGTCTISESTTTVTTYNSGSLVRAGWRYGFVALLKSGERVYGDMSKGSSGTVEFIIPENCSRLWFVVLGAPKTYESHAWDEDESNDDQWPYKVKLTNTDLLGNISFEEGTMPSDLTLTYDISFAADALAYSGMTVNLNENGDIVKLAKAFVLQPSAITALMTDAKTTATEGKVAFAAVETAGTNYSTTANGYGFWFGKDGSVQSWGENSYIFSEFSSSSFEFTIGQYPGKCSSGDTYTVKEALIYTLSGKSYQVTFVFNITIK